ncbi:unnamed protein product, partial [Rotaria socialis]
GLTLVWIDRNLDDPDVDKLLKKFHLPERMREIIYYIRAFKNTVSAVEYISSVAKEDIFLVLPPEDATDESMMFQLVSQPRVKSVYIFDPDNKMHEFKPDNKVFKFILQPKGRGVFTTQTTLVLKLKSDVDLYYTNLSVPFNVLNSDQIERSMRNLTQESVTFMWYHIMIDILLRLEHNEDAKREMMDTCRKAYSSSTVCSSKVLEFEQTYKSKDAAAWYTKDTFVYRIVNWALRTQDPDTIYKFRYYICDLHTHLVNTHPKFISTLGPEQQTLNLYRGQSMTIEEFNRCSAQALISMNTFLSTSEDSVVALRYAGDGTTDSVQSVFFELEIDPKLDTKPYAYLQENVIQESEREVLF